MQIRIPWGKGLNIMLSRLSSFRNHSHSYAANRFWLTTPSQTLLAAKLNSSTNSTSSISNSSSSSATPTFALPGKSFRIRYWKFAAIRRWCYAADQHGTSVNDSHWWCRYFCSIIGVNLFNKLYMATRWHLHSHDLKKQSTNKTKWRLALGLILD